MVPKISRDMRYFQRFQRGNPIRPASLYNHLRGVRRRPGMPMRQKTQPKHFPKRQHARRRVASHLRGHKCGDCGLAPKTFCETLKRWCTNRQYCRKAAIFACMDLTSVWGFSRAWRSPLAPGKTLWRRSMGGRVIISTAVAQIPSCSTELAARHHPPYSTEEKAVDPARE